MLHPHTGNKGGSYITIMSLGGLEFGILNIIGSFGNVWCAQSSLPCGLTVLVGRVHPVSTQS